MALLASDVHLFNLKALKRHTLTHTLKQRHVISLYECKSACFPDKCVFAYAGFSSLSRIHPFLIFKRTHRCTHTCSVPLGEWSKSVSGFSVSHSDRTDRTDRWWEGGEDENWKWIFEVQACTPPPAFCLASMCACSANGRSAGLIRGECNEALHTPCRSAHVCV